MAQSFAVIIAWPDTQCKQAGAWYDKSMSLLGVSNNGYYRVGHAAIVLVNGEDGACRYFDFGRYHAPHGFGRIRDQFTDHDLRILTTVKFDSFGNPQLDELMNELTCNPSCHGDGAIKYGLTPIDYQVAFKAAKKLQAEEFIPYGPFIYSGTNCSRFVRSIALKGTISFFDRVRLLFPPMFSPTPMWNVLATRKYSKKVVSMKNLIMLKK